MEMATNRPVTMVPISMAPRVANAALWPPKASMMKYTMIGAKTGSMEGMIISRMAALVSISTAAP